jgi:hypothetical protein
LPVAGENLTYTQENVDCKKQGNDQKPKRKQNMLRSNSVKVVSFARQKPKNHDQDTQIQNQIRDTLGLISQKNS